PRTCIYAWVIANCVSGLQSRRSPDSSRTAWFEPASGPFISGFRSQGQSAQAARPRDLLLPRFARPVADRFTSSRSPNCHHFGYDAPCSQKNVPSLIFTAGPILRLSGGRGSCSGVWEMSKEWSSSKLVEYLTAAGARGRTRSELEKKVPKQVQSGT